MRCKNNKELIQEGLLNLSKLLQLLIPNEIYHCSPDANETPFGWNGDKQAALLSTLTNTWKLSISILKLAVVFTALLSQVQIYKLGTPSTLLIL